MDPEQALKDARRLADAGYVEAALERYQALDEWVSRGGVLPIEWVKIFRSNTI